MARVGQSIGVRAAILLCLLFAAPLLLPGVPPLSDFPGHLGQYRLMLADNRVPELARGYGFHWQLIGNLGVDLPVRLLAPLLGLEPAAKLIVVLIPMLTVAGMLWLAREVHKRVPPMALFALPLAYAYPFQFGFVNYTLALALAFCAAALWVRLARRAALRAALFAAIALILWIAHSIAWAAFGLIALGIELGRLRDVRQLPRAALAMLPLLTPVIVMALTAHGGPPQQLDWALRDKGNAIASLMRDRWMVADIATAALLYALVIWGMASNRFTAAPMLRWPAILCGIAFVLLPFDALGGSYVDMRLLPLAVTLALLSLDGGPAWLWRAGWAFVALRLILTLVSYALFGQQVRDEGAAIARIPRGSSVLVLVNRPCKRAWALSRMDHFGSMALVRRDAFVNDQWTVAGSHMVQVRAPNTAPFDRDPSQFAYDGPCAKQIFPQFDDVIARFDRRGFDHVWTIGFPSGRAHAGDLQPIWHNASSALYRVQSPIAAATTAGRASASN